MIQKASVARNRFNFERQIGLLVAVKTLLREKMDGTNSPRHKLADSKASAEFEARLPRHEHFTGNVDASRCKGHRE